MSMESAVAFYERVETDAALQEQIRELGAQERIEQYVKGDLGYDFTREEMQQVIFQRNPELTDEELEAVTGGVGIIELIIVAYALAVAAA
jgi:predicted ribosomally synthesized peptide with nif11-like leader